MKIITRSEALKTWIQSSAPKSGVELAWVGQAGFLIRSAEVFIGIDLYLSDSLAKKYQGATYEHIRMMEIPIEPEALGDLEMLLSTHAHTDHLDKETIEAIYLQGSPLFVGPRAEAQKALERGVGLEHAVFVSGFEVFEALGVRIEVLPSAHETLEVDHVGNDRALGYIIELGDVRIYHSGDCVPYEGLEFLLRERDIDLALLPVNGRDVQRTQNGILGNFTAEEAITLVSRSNIPHLIVHHFGLFDFNTISLEELKELQNTHTSMIISSVGEIYHFEEQL